MTKQPQLSHDIAERYFAYIREQNLTAIVALFAHDASCTMPDGRSFAGQAAVHEWFKNLFAAQTLSPRAVAMIKAPSAVAVEIENDLPDGTKRNTANFFHLDDTGLIAQLHVYTRSSTRPA